MAEDARDDQPRTVTLRDVARRAGVNVSTASRALSGRRRVSPGIERRVKSAASALGYSPNEMAVNFRLSRTMTLGLVVPKFGSPVLLDFVEGLGSGIEEHDYSLMLTIARGDPDHYRTLVQRLIERRVDALFLASPPDLGAALQTFERGGRPVMALFSRGSGPATLPLLTASEADAIGCATERLAALGHHRVWYLGNSETAGSIRVTWLEQAAHQAGLSLSVETVPYQQPATVLQERIRERLQARDAPTAIFAEPDALPRLMHALSALGVPVPAGVSLVAFGESPWMLEFGRPVASIRHDLCRLGRIAASTMLGWLQGERPPDVISAGVAEWVEHASVGPAPVAPGTLD